MAARHPRAAATLTGLLLGSSAAAVLAVVLALVAFGAARPGRPVAVQDLVEVGVAGIGALTAAWLALSCGLGAACVLGRALGAQWRAGERAFRRVAPVVVRRAVAGAVGASLGLGLVATGANAAPVVDATPVATASPVATAGTDAAAADVPVADGGAGAHDRGTAPIVDDLAVPDPLAPSLGWPTTTTPTTPAPSPSAVPSPTAVPSSTAVPSATAAPSPSAAPALSAAASPSGDPSPDPGPSPSAAASPGAAPTGAPAESSRGTWTPAPPVAPTVETSASAQDADPAGLAQDPVRPARGAARDQVVVLRGDSLWTIAAAHLPDGATAADVAAAWPRWYEANRDVVGDDPDVLLPGQILRIPDLPATGTTRTTQPDPTAATSAAPTTLEGR